MSLSMVGSTKEGIPVMLLKEGSSETKGKNAMRNNIEAAKLIATMLRSVLGPRGMDKMLVDQMGDVTITNDGATILKDMDVQHPAAKMIVEVAKTVDDEVGDGTTCSVIVAGALLDEAEKLMKDGTHPTVIVEGYRKALSKSLEILEEISQKVSITDHDTLVKLARTCMESKIVSADSDILAELAIRAVLSVAEKLGDSSNQRLVDLDNVKVGKKAGGSMRDSTLVEGIILEKGAAHPEMPTRIESAKILLVNSPLEIEKTEFEAKISIDRPEQMKGFLEEETRMLKAMVDNIVSVEADVVVCQKGIDDMALYYLSKAGVLAVSRAKESDLVALSRATGAKIVSNLEELTIDNLGFAQLVEEKKVETDSWVFVERCRNPKSVSLLLRGGSQRVVDEAERSIHDALMVIKDVIERPAIVAGGGSPEAHVARVLRKWSTSISGREHLAIAAFADALESIPLALAENAGMDLIDSITQLHAIQESSNSPWIGVDVRNSRIADMMKGNIIEPLVVKEQVLKSSTEVAAMILRIDDILSSSRTGSKS
jgi:thermosome